MIFNIKIIVFNLGLSEHFDDDQKLGIYRISANGVMVLVEAKSMG